MSSFSLQTTAIIILVASIHTVWSAEVSVNSQQGKSEASANSNDQFKSSQQLVTTTISPSTTTTTTTTTTSTTVKPRVTGLLSNLQSGEDAWSMVSVDKNPNTGFKNKVDVHIPLVFDMTNDKNNSKLDLSVLSGMVTVNRDKGRQPNGAITGPLTVSIFGIPIYSGQAAPPKVPQTSSTTVPRGDFGVSTRYDTDYNIDSMLRTGTNRDIDELLPEPTNPIYENMKRVNKKLLNHLADSLNKLALYVGHKAEPISHMPGNPATKADGFVGQSTFLKSDFEPKIVYRNATTKGSSTTRAPSVHLETPTNKNSTSYRS